MKNLEEAYLIMERKVATIGFSNELTAQLKELLTTTSDERVKRLIQIEIWVHDFSMREGKVEPVMSSTYEDGSEFNYPSLTNFKEADYEYLKERASNVTSQYLILRYNQILWNGPKGVKNGEYAKRTIDANYLLLSNHETKETRNWISLTKNALSLCNVIDYRTQELMDQVRSDILQSPKLKEPWKYHLLKWMAKQRKLKDVAFDGVLSYLEGQSRSKIESESQFSEQESLCEAGLKVSQKIGADQKEWNEKLGEVHFQFAEMRLDDKSRIVPLAELSKAVTFFKKAGNQKKAIATAKRYSEIKRELTLNEIRVPLDADKYDELRSEHEKRIDIVLRSKAVEIWGYLATDGRLFPSVEFVNRLANQEVDSFLDLVSTWKFDINKNVSVDNNPKETTEFNKSYNLYLQLETLPYLIKLFYKAVESNSLNYKSLIEFFARHSWLGQRIEDCDAAGNVFEYTWLSTLAPGFHDFFLQVESHIRDDSSILNLVLSLDSLTMKFEGALREFSRFVGANTTTSGKNDNWREMYIDELLVQPELTQHFHENDLTLFKHIFVSKNGLNLRNNIAHTFYRFSDYSLDKLILVILAFLRLGKYRITVKD